MKLDAVMPALTFTLRTRQNGLVAALMLANVPVFARMPSTPAEALPIQPLGTMRSPAVTATAEPVLNI